MFPSLNAIEIQTPVVDLEEQAVESDLFFDASRQSQNMSESWNLQVAAAIERASEIDLVLVALTDKFNALFYYGNFPVG